MVGVEETIEDGFQLSDALLKVLTLVLLHILLVVIQCCAALLRLQGSYEVGIDQSRSV